MSVFQVDDLTARLDAAVRLGSAAAIVTRVKTELESLIGHDGMRLPDRFYATRSDSYARRLLYRDPKGRYTAVVMTWGPNQGTPLHDHSGIWCVEGVVKGSLEVTQYRIEGDAGEAFRFSEMGRVLAGVGSAGSLIPPLRVPHAEECVERRVVTDAAHLRRRDDELSRLCAAGRRHLRTVRSSASVR